MIAAIHKNEIIAAGLGVGNGRDQSRRAAKAFAFDVAVFGTTRIIFADRFKTGMKIIGVQK